IENTDTSREVAESVEQIQRSLTWLGIDWDGDLTFQLDRMDTCRELAQKLVDEGSAYLDEGAIRIRMPDDGVTAWDDVVKGRREGYLSAALMNFLALLGWSYDDKTTIMSRDELVERFTLERVGASPATFDYAKLDWMNGVYLRALTPDEFGDALVVYLREQGY